MSKKASASESSGDKLSRIAIVDADSRILIFFLFVSYYRILILTYSQPECKPKKCRQECKKSCPVVKMGKQCIEVRNEQGNTLCRSNQRARLLLSVNHCVLVAIFVPKSVRLMRLILSICRRILIKK